MKILVAKFQLEANENIPMKCDIENVALSFGQKALSHMQLGDVFNQEEIELIPVLCADAGCSGVMKKGCFDYIEQRILNTIKEHLPDLDGIYLHLHGASYVEEIGSGDHHLVKRIRSLVGPYFPIAVSCDPHGNLTKEYVENTTFIRSYRQSPHTDIESTVQRVAQELINEIRHHQGTKPVYRKLPLILGGEQSVSTDEPVRSINRYLDELEKDVRIRSASWHVGYLRHDCAEAGCGIVIIPATQKDQVYAEDIADVLQNFIMDKRHEFHYTGTTAKLDEALKIAVEFDAKPVFITDSGDNVTSGAMGANTVILKEVLAKKFSKRFLFAAIHDGQACHFLQTKKIGESVKFRLGMNINEYSQEIELEGTILAHGRQEGTHMYGEEGDYGPLITVRVLNTRVDVVITDNNHSFVEKHQLFACGVDWDDYDVIVVKQGYIHPELKEKGAMSIMALTGGATPQDTCAIPFKRIMRPMFPIDEIN